MKIEKSIIHGIIFRWMRSDEKLLKVLHPNHIQILCMRLIEEKTFKELSREYGFPPNTMRRAFGAVLNRIRQNFGNGVYTLFQTINSELELQVKAVDKALKNTAHKNYKWN